MKNATTDTVHVFELAGLGKAPFRFAGLIEQNLCYGQAVIGEIDGIQVTTKPGGTCDFCGTYIVRMYQIVSADGQKHKVGCDCIRKTGDEGLVRRVEAAEKAHAATQRRIRASRVEADVRSALADDATRERLASLPHPKGWADRSLLDWADWMLQNAGASGLSKVAKAIKS